MSGEVRTVEEWIALTAQRLRRAGLFFGHGTDNARDEAAWLVAAAIKVAPPDLWRNLENAVKQRESRRIVTLTEKRIATRKPLAYLLGEAWLSGHRFLVDQRVIIPRSFIAELLADGLRPWCPRPGAVKRVLDLCTGSGCLAVLAAFAFPRARIDAADISRAALAVAQKNVRAYSLGNRISLIHSDLFQELPAHEYDLIISNPPYVKAQSMRKLPPEYRSEPVIALAGGSDGLDSVARIVTEAPPYLKPGGHLLLEIGHNRATFERRYPGLPVTWPTTSSNSDSVLWVPARELAGLK